MKIVIEIDNAELSLLGVRKKAVSDFVKRKIKQSSTDFNMQDWRNIVLKRAAITVIK